MNYYRVEDDMTTTERSDTSTSVAMNNRAQGTKGATYSFLVELRGNLIWCVVRFRRQNGSHVARGETGQFRGIDELQRVSGKDTNDLLLVLCTTEAAPFVPSLPSSSITDPKNLSPQKPHP